MDLFNDGVMIISTLPGTGEEAVQKVLDLAAQVGAIPMFSDSMEADGLLSQTDLFPRVVNMLLVQGLKNQSGWSDAQKLTGPIFWQMSKLLFEFPSGESASHEIMTHKDNMLRLLDMLRGQIDSLQDSH